MLSNGKSITEGRVGTETDRDRQAGSRQTEIDRENKETGPSTLHTDT
jgi:hypothetical protein